MVGPSHHCFALYLITIILPIRLCRAQGGSRTICARTHHFQSQPGRLLSMQLFRIWSMDVYTLLYPAFLPGRRWVLGYPSWVETSAKCCWCRLRISFWWPPDADDGKVLLAHCSGILNLDPRNPPNHPVHWIGTGQHVWYLGWTRSGWILHWDWNHHNPHRADRQRRTRGSGRCDSVLVSLSVSRFRRSLVSNCQCRSAIFTRPTTEALE